MEGQRTGMTKDWRDNEQWRDKGLEEEWTGSTMNNGRTGGTKDWEYNGQCKDNGLEG
jgi:hypothetical protein